MRSEIVCCPHEAVLAWKRPPKITWPSLVHTFRQDLECAWSGVFGCGLATTSLSPPLLGSATLASPAAATVFPELSDLARALFQHSVAQALAGRTRRRNVASSARNEAANTRRKCRHPRFCNMRGASEAPTPDQLP